MDVYIRMLYVLFHKFFSLIQRFFKRKWICPSKVGCICRRVEVIKRMRKRYVEAVVFIFPLIATLTSFPLHRVGLNSINCAQAHFVELALLGHPLDCKC